MTAPGRVARLGFALALALLAPRALAGGRLARAEVELEGPLSGLEFETEGGDRLLLGGALVAGERQRLVLELPVPAGARASGRAPAEPRARWEVDADGPRGRVRFLGWLPDADDGLEALPPGLRARGRPPLELARASAGPTALGLLAAALCAVVALRRRPRLALACGLAGAVLAAAVVRAAGPGPARLRVLEGERAAPRWLEVRAAAGVLSLRGADPSAGRLDVEPAGARLVVERGGDPQDPGAVRVRAGRAKLYWTRWAPPAEGLGTTRNDWRDLDRAWVRRDGVWSALGRWPAGTDAPPGTAGAPEAGWLLAGLPQGVDVLLATWAAPDGPVWLRLTE